MKANAKENRRELICLSITKANAKTNLQIFICNHFGVDGTPRCGSRAKCRLEGTAVWARPTYGDCRVQISGLRGALEISRVFRGSWTEDYRQGLQVTSHPLLAITDADTNSLHINKCSIYRCRAEALRNRFRNNIHGSSFAEWINLNFVEFDCLSCRVNFFGGGSCRRIVVPSPFCFAGTLSGKKSQKKILVKILQAKTGEEGGGLWVGEGGKEGGMRERNKGVGGRRNEREEGWGNKGGWRGKRAKARKDEARDGNGR